MMQELEKETIERIRSEAIKTATSIKELEADKGDYIAPINADIIKTEKAMFYERCLEILRERKQKIKNKKS